MFVDKSKPIKSGIDLIHLVVTLCVKDTLSWGANQMYITSMVEFLFYTLVDLYL